MTHKKTQAASPLGLHKENIGLVLLLIRIE